MICDRSGEITAFLKGEVSERERESLQRHIELCSECSRELVDARRVLEAVRAMEPLEPSPGFAGRIRAFVAAREQAPEEVSGWSHVPAWAVSAAVHVVLAGLAAILIFTPAHPQEELDRIAVQAIPAFAAAESPRFAPWVGAPEGARRLESIAPRDAEPAESAWDRGVPPDPEMPSPFVRPPSEGAKFDAAKWRERIPRERLLLAFFEGRAEHAGKNPQAKSVRSGLKWLARVQQPDGRWTGPSLKSDEGGGEYSYGVGLTGLALLTFLSEGNTRRSGDYREVVEKGITYLLGEQRVSGLIGSDRGHYMYDHGVAALALLEASLMEHDEALETAVAAAVNYVVSSQNATGGWGYVSRAPNNDTCVAGWQIQVLRLAKLSGHRGVIPSLVQAHDRLVRMTDADGRVGYQDLRQYPNGYSTLTAVGMLAHLLSTPTPDVELMNRQAGVLLERCPVSESYMETDLVCGLFGSLAMHQRGGDDWARWYDPLVARLVQAQTSEGCWPADFDRWHAYGGQVYTTAAALQILQVPTRYPRILE